MLSAADAASATKRARLGRTTLRAIQTAVAKQIEADMAADDDADVQAFVDVPAAQWNGSVSKTLEALGFEVTLREAKCFCNTKPCPLQSKSCSAQCTRISWKHAM